MPVVREGQPCHQSGRVLAGAAGKPECRYPAPGVLLPGGPAVAPDFAAAAAAPACFPPPCRAARRAVSGELTVLSETVTNVDFNAFYRAERVSLVRFVMFLGADPGTA